MKTMIRFLYDWHWDIEMQAWNLSITPYGKSKATVWPNGTWHTWDKDGVGGENGRYAYWQYCEFEELHYAAKREAFKSCVSQKFI